MRSGFVNTTQPELFTLIASQSKLISELAVLLQMLMRPDALFLSLAVLIGEASLYIYAGCDINQLKRLVEMLKSC